jgi:hypothetical protein
MIRNNHIVKSVIMFAIASSLAVDATVNELSAEQNDGQAVAFPDKYMVRLGAYIVDDTDTQFSVASDLGGIGTTIDYQRNLGGEKGETIPRIDAYYRFNERHRMDFTAFSVDRKGSRTLAVDPPIVIGDENFAGGTVNSDIKYTLYKLGYAYSFYRSPKVELGLSAGLNITSYDLTFSSDVGNKYESAGFTAPLPMFGLRMGYAITPKWNVRYVSEAFFIDIDDTFRGAILNYELTTEYKIFKHFALGAGVARLGINADIDDDDWRGSVTDTYAGYMLFGTFYF